MSGSTCNRFATPWLTSDVDGEDDTRVWRAVGDVGDITAVLSSTCVSFGQGPGAEPVDGVWIALNDSYWGHRFTSTVDNGIGDSECYLVADDAETVIDDGHNGLGPCAGTVPEEAAYIFLYSWAAPATAMTLTFDRGHGL